MLIPASAKVSAIADIAIFTQQEEVTWRGLKKIVVLENGGPAISNKSNDKEIRSYFEKVLPEFDRERVYTSDIKKVITWYNLLQSKGLLDVLNQTDEDEKPQTDSNE